MFSSELLEGRPLMGMQLWHNLKTGNTHGQCIQKHYNFLVTNYERYMALLKGRSVSEYTGQVVKGTNHQLTDSDINVLPRLVERCRKCQTTKFGLSHNGHLLSLRICYDFIVNNLCELPQRKTHIKITIIIIIMMMIASTLFFVNTIWYGGKE